MDGYLSSDFGNNSPFYSVSQGQDDLAGYILWLRKADLETRSPLKYGLPVKAYNHPCLILDAIQGSEGNSRYRIFTLTSFSSKSKEEALICGRQPGHIPILPSPKNLGCTPSQLELINGATLDRNSWVKTSEFYYVPMSVLKSWQNLPWSHYRLTQDSLHKILKAFPSPLLPRQVEERIVTLPLRVPSPEVDRSHFPPIMNQEWERQALHPATQGTFRGFHNPPRAERFGYGTIVDNDTVEANRPLDDPQPFSAPTTSHEVLSSWGRYFRARGQDIWSITPTAKQIRKFCLTIGVVALICFVVGGISYGVYVLIRSLVHFIKQICQGIAQAYLSASGAIAGGWRWCNALVHNILGWLVDIEQGMKSLIQKAIAALNRFLHRI